MARGHARSAKTGLRIEGHGGAASPHHGDREHDRKGGGKAYRSAITGKYVTKETAQRHRTRR